MADSDVDNQVGTPGFNADKASITKTLKGAGGNIFNRTLGRLFGAKLPAGAEGPMATNEIAAWSKRTNQTDWRVKLTLRKNEDMYNFFFGAGSSQSLGFGGATGDKVAKTKILSPLSNDGGIIFPLTPSVIIQHNANYNALATTHSNYPFYAYQNSEPANMTIVGEFPVQNQSDAQYWVATLHFLRSVTKMFFGGDDTANRGNPPPILTLNGYGNHVFKNIPCIVTTFTVELTQGVDYISTSQNNKIATPNQSSQVYNPQDSLPETWAPTQSIFTVQLQPIYSRDTIKNFSMREFVDGKLVNKNGIGFI